MLNYFLLSSKDRVSEWKKLRENLTNAIPVKNKCKLIVDFWKHAPISTKTLLDWDDCESWPTAWELLDKNNYCYSSLALGMFYSLFYAQDPIQENLLQLCLINCQSHSWQHICLLVDNCWMLNYEHGSVKNTNSIKENYLIQNTWKYHKKQFVAIDFVGKNKNKLPIEI